MAAPDDTVLDTDRLILREWRDADIRPFAALSTDPDVMRYYPYSWDERECRAAIERYRVELAANGFGRFAVEIKDTGEFAGYVGLARATFEAPFTPAIEIGWRLAKSAWGKGYATEAARAVLDHGFKTVGIGEIVSFTTVANSRSRAVMERLGMTRDPAEDFDHPVLEPGDPLLHHVLYRLKSPSG